MPRRERPLFAGGVYHVYNRGVAKLPIYLGSGDRARFMSLLCATVARGEWACLAHCLMGNHFHLVVETPRGDLDRGMQWLQARYAEGFNREHDRSGHLFQSRYGATVLEDGDEVRSAVRYVVRNPVAAGLCRRPSEWRWSSHAAVLGLAARPAHLAIGRLLGLFGAPGTSVAAYAAYVEDSPAPDPPRPGELGPAAGLRVAGVRRQP
jgi:REP-associated tyrosine transposase